MLYNFIQRICTLFVVRKTILFVIYICLYKKNSPQLVVKYKTDVRQFKNTVLVYESLN